MIYRRALLSVLALTSCFFAGCHPPGRDAMPRSARRVKVLEPPGRNAYCRVDPAGFGILPNGRFVRPAGRFALVECDPFGLCLAPNGKTILAIHDGVLTVAPTDQLGEAVRLPSFDRKLPGPFERGAFMGGVVAPDNRLAYLSGGDSGNVIVFDLETRRRTATISLNGSLDGRDYADSFTGELVLSPDAGRLYAIDQFNFRVVEIDLASSQRLRSFPSGRFPFGAALSPDGATLYVANVGVFDYPLVPGVDPANIDETALKFPAYGFPSRAAEGGAVVEGKQIPGLGSPHVPEAVSVWALDVASGAIRAQVKTGYRMGEMVEGLEVVGGASPNSIAAGSRHVFVSNATNDNLSVLDPATGKIAQTLRLTIDPRIDRFRGLLPFGLALSPDQSRLYVALSGLNAVAVVDAVNPRVLGYLPTGWFPTKLAVSPDGRQVVVATARGLGAGPNGGFRFQRPVQGTYVGDIMLGTIEVIDLPDEAGLARYTQQVLDNTFLEAEVDDDPRHPLPARADRPSPIRHVVYITKENRTYDEVFGQEIAGRGDATLARYGRNARVGNRAARVENVTVMPNHLEVARQFTISDNFYCDSDASVHGHRWMVGTYPNEWVEASAATTKSLSVTSPAPGRKYVTGSSGAVYPEDYNEAGGMWEHLARHGVSFFNFGLGFEFAAADEGPMHIPSGVRMRVSFPMPEPLFQRTSRNFPTYNTSIPDQFRADMFEKELGERWLSGNEPFPQLVTIMLPNDHAAGERPQAGYPFRESYMADNDLALGRVLQRLSRTPYWKHMLVIVTEDDAQDGRDSVDAHRSLLMLVGPWVKRGYVSHTHANFGAILRTIYHILGVPALNQFDATASLLNDCFTLEPDLRPFEAVPVDSRIFDPQKALDPYDRDFDPQWLEDSPEIDADDDFRREHARETDPGNQPEAVPRVTHERPSEEAAP